MKIIIKLVLLLAIIGLAYVVFESIATPIRFQEAKEIRYKKVITRLIEIRTAQLAFKDVNGYFSNDFDQLINFIKTDSMPLIRAIGQIPDHLLDSMTETMAIEAGIITRDTIKISYLDTLFSKDYILDSMPYIPFSCGEKFKLASGEVETGSKQKVKVFEALATNAQILKGLDKDYFDPKDVLKVGSLTEATNNSGNWE